MIYFKKANLEDWQKEYEALQKIPAVENGTNNDYFGMEIEEFRDVSLPELITRSTSEDWVKSGHVPETYYFLWDDNRIVGRYKLRHCLSDGLRKWGGHIAYSILPEYRGKGYGTEGLRLIIEEAKKIVPEDELYLTARVDNIASIRVMEKNGAYKVAEAERDGVKAYLLRIKIKEDKNENH